MQNMNQDAESAELIEIITEQTTALMQEIRDGNLDRPGDEAHTAKVKEMRDNIRGFFAAITESFMPWQTTFLLGDYCGHYNLYVLEEKIAQGERWAIKVLEQQKRYQEGVRDAEHYLFEMRGCVTVLFDPNLPFSTFINPGDVIFMQRFKKAFVGVCKARDRLQKIQLFIEKAARENMFDGEVIRVQEKKEAAG